MIWLLNDVLTPVESGNILSVYTEHRFHCGSDSNPREGVKKSSVLNYDDPDYKRCMQTLYTPLQKGLSDFLIRRSGQPYFVWYKTGGFYKWHLDAFPIAGIAPHFSFTVALNDPDEYEGGELITKMNMNENSCKLDKGEVFVFPSWMLHKVTPVTKGKRKVIVGWGLGPVV